MALFEQIALTWARAARISTDETQLAAWRNAAHAGVMRSKSNALDFRRGKCEASDYGAESRKTDPMPKLRYGISALST